MYFRLFECCRVGGCPNRFQLVFTFVYVEVYVRQHAPALCTARGRPGAGVDIPHQGLWHFGLAAGGPPSLDVASHLHKAESHMHYCVHNPCMPDRNICFLFVVCPTNIFWALYIGCYGWPTRHYSLPVHPSVNAGASSDVKRPSN